jgi:hypothetical protein
VTWSRRNKLAATHATLVHTLACTMFSATLSAPAAAQSWTSLTSARARVESNNNPSLSPEGDDTVTTGTVSISAKNTRSTETARSRAELEFVVSTINKQDNTGVNGSLVLGHSFEHLRHSAAASLNLRQEQTGERTTVASEVALGRGRRYSSEADLGWGYALSERFGSQLRWSGAHTRYSGNSNQAANASDFQSHTASAGLNGLFSETASVNLNLSRTQTRQQDGASQARIDTLRVSGNTQWLETTSLAVSMGLSHTKRQQTAQRLVCPLPISFCNGGVVSFISVPVEFNSRNNDVQYSAALAHRLDESNSLNLNLSRALSPGGFGVAQEDSINFSWNRAVSDTSSAAFNVADSRSRFEGASPRAASRLRIAGASLSTALSPDLNLSAGLQLRSYEEPGARARGTSRQLSISVQYTGPRLFDRP